jgi:hypothetical protein
MGGPLGGYGKGGGKGGGWGHQGHGGYGKGGGKGGKDNRRHPYGGNITAARPRSAQRGRQAQTSESGNGGNLDAALKTISKRQGNMPKHDTNGRALCYVFMHNLFRAAPGGWNKNAEEHLDDDDLCPAGIHCPHHHPSNRADVPACNKAPGTCKAGAKCWYRHAAQPATAGAAPRMLPVDNQLVTILQGLQATMADIASRTASLETALAGASANNYRPFPESQDPNATPTGDDGVNYEEEDMLGNSTRNSEISNAPSSSTQTRVTISNVSFSIHNHVRNHIIRAENTILDPQSPEVTEFCTNSLYAIRCPIEFTKMKSFDLNTKTQISSDGTREEIVLEPMNPHYNDCGISQRLHTLSQWPSIAFFNSYYCHIKWQSDSDSDSYMLPKAASYRAIGISNSAMYDASRESNVNLNWPRIHTWPNTLRYIYQKRYTKIPELQIQNEKHFAGLITAFIDSQNAGTTNVPLTQQLSVFRKSSQQLLDNILSDYHSVIPLPNGNVERIPVFIKGNTTTNWNTKHPYYQNWRSMVARGLDSNSVDYATVRVDPAFMGLRNDAAGIFHYDKYGFFTYVRAVDFFIGSKPCSATASEVEPTAEFNPRAGLHHYQMDRTNPRYHYTINNMRWLPDSDNIHAKFSNQ